MLSGCQAGVSPSLLTRYRKCAFMLMVCKTLLPHFQSTPNVFAQSVSRLRRVFSVRLCIFICASDLVPNATKGTITVSSQVFKIFHSHKTAPTQNQNPHLNPSKIPKVKNILTNVSYVKYNCLCKRIMIY